MSVRECWTVYKTRFESDPWCVFNEFGSDDIIEYFPTHAKAIEYADRMAQTTQGEKH